MRAEFHNLPDREFELRLGIDKAILAERQCIELFDEIVKTINNGIDKDPKVTVCLLKDGSFERINGLLEMVLSFDATHDWLVALENFEFPRWITQIRILHLPDEEIRFEKIYYCKKRG